MIGVEIPIAGKLKNWTCSLVLVKMYPEQLFRNTILTTRNIGTCIRLTQQYNTQKFVFSSNSLASIIRLTFSHNVKARGNLLSNQLVIHRTGCMIQVLIALVIDCT